MKVLIINGSPHPKGCTARALKEVAETLTPQRQLRRSKCKEVAREFPMPFFCEL